MKYVLTLLLAAGLLSGQSVMAGDMDSWQEKFFRGKNTAEVMESIGATKATDSKDIVIIAAEIAESGAVVPVEVKVGMSNVKTIALIAEQNGSPGVTIVDVSKVEAYVNTRIKMGKTGNVTAVVITNDGKAYKNSKEIKVTAGGCGG